MSKNKKKNLKKVHAKIDTKTIPVKAEAAKKEESKAANKKVNGDEVEKLAEKLTTESLKNASKKDLKSIIVTAKKAGNKELVKKAKEEKEKKKYAASKARIEARNARKQAAKDMLNGVKHTKDAAPVKITLEERKKRQEERRKIAYNRHIASIRRRCSRMHLSDAQTDAVVNKAKEQWDKAKSYNIVMVCDSFGDKREKLFDIVKKHSIKTACITTCTAFLNSVPKAAVDEIRETFTDASVYQYAEKCDLFGNYKKDDSKKPKKGGNAHSIECSKSRSVNFYNLRRLQKAAKEKAEKNAYDYRHGKKAEGRKARRLLKKENAKPVNKKPTQVKRIKEKSNKQAA